MHKEDRYFMFLWLYLTGPWRNEQCFLVHSHASAFYDVCLFYISAYIVEGKHIILLFSSYIFMNLLLFLIDYEQPLDSSDVVSCAFTCQKLASSYEFHSLLLLLIWIDQQMVQRQKTNLIKVSWVEIDIHIFKPNWFHFC